MTQYELFDACFLHIAFSNLTITMWDPHVHKSSKGQTEMKKCVLEDMKISYNIII